jgi:uncharacterized membrane protein
MLAPDGNFGTGASLMDEKQPAAQATAHPQSLPFRAVLAPHRSLSPRGFFILMAILGGVSFAMGLAFAFIGAWPVLGFFGLDVAIVYLAFKLNYRAARATETVEVTRDDLIITRTDARGRTRSVTRLNSTWAKLEEQEAPDGTVALSLALHGRRYGIGRHLNSDERRSFASALRAALRLVRERA